jgi:hypothetical protein
MSKKFGVKIIEKRKSPFMILISWFLGFLNLFWKSVPSRKEFMKDFSTTIGNRFYIRAEVGEDIDPVDAVYLLIHEFEHTEQFRREFFMPLKYLLFSKWRARYEAEACETKIDMGWRYELNCSDDTKFHVFVSWAKRKSKQWSEYYGCSDAACKEGENYLSNRALQHQFDSPKINGVVAEAAIILKDLGVI